MTALLPKIFRWVFMVLAVLCMAGAVGVLIAMLVDPRLPPGTHFGPLHGQFAGQPATAVLNPFDGDSNFTATALNGSVVLFVDRAGGLIEVLKHYGFPVVLFRLVFFATLFELLRRLFRNVGRGESFTMQSIRLVQIIAGTLLAYSVVASLAEGWFVHAVYAYLAQHATVTISGTALHLPSPDRMHGHSFSLDAPIFFSGLLVLALSEVFRQGLVLKSEADLTV